MGTGETCLKCGKLLSNRAELGPDSEDKNYKNFTLHCSNPNCDYTLTKRVEVKNIKYEEGLIGPLTVKQAMYVGIILVILGYLFFK